MQSTTPSEQHLRAPDRTEMLSTEIWALIFENLSMALNEAEVQARKPKLGAPFEWYASRITSVPSHLRLISVRLGAIATPLAFKRCYLTEKLLSSTYDGDEVTSRIRSLIRTFAQYISIPLGMSSLSALSFLAECMALQDLEWEEWRAEETHQLHMVKRLLLRQLPHVRLHISCPERDGCPIALIPTQNLTSLSVWPDNQEEAVCGLLLAAKWLKNICLRGHVEISPQTGQFPSIRELRIEDHYKPHPNHRLWDFSELRRLDLKLIHIEEFLQEVAPAGTKGLPKMRIMRLFYPQNMIQRHEIIRSRSSWTRAVQLFLDERTVPQLEELVVHCSNPLLLAPHLAHAAPAVKRLMLHDVGRIFNIVMPIPVTPFQALELLDIHVPHAILVKDDEDAYTTTVCVLERLHRLRICFAADATTFPGNGQPIIKDFQKQRFRNLMERVKEIIVRKKAGVPLRQLVLESRVWISASTGDPITVLNYTWDSEGEEHLEVATDHSIFQADSLGPFWDEDDLPYSAWRQHNLGLSQ